MKDKIFREYDIRGIYPIDINEESAYIFGKGYGSYIQEKLDRHVCCIGRDNRLSSPSLHSSLLQGLIDTGIKVVDLGLITTPMLSYTLNLTKSLGIMVTASHNPKDDNGFKFTLDEFGFARGNQVYDLRDYIKKENFIKGNGEVIKFNILPYYTSLLIDNTKMGNKHLKVVIDPGNGTTSLFVKDIYNKFSNLDITYINDISDATFPNHHPDPAVKENLKQLQQKVLELKADIGIAYDGDGDRVGFIDNEGKILEADKFLALAGSYYLKNEENKTLLYDVKCSYLIKDIAKECGITATMYRTGASYTRTKILKDNIKIGGEFSGHIVFNDRFRGFDSGLYSGLRMLEILSNSNDNLSILTKDYYKYFNTQEIKVPTPDDIKFQVIDKVKEYCGLKKYPYLNIDGVRIENPTSWALIRCSNTGPNITLRFEATTKKELSKLQDEFTRLVAYIKDRL